MLNITKEKGFIAVIRNKYIPFPGYRAINLFLFLFIRPKVVITEILLNHERIHSKQIIELGFIFFYLWYLIEYLIRLCIDKETAYYNISFEKEAYNNELNLDYLKTRKWYSFIKYL